ncbi:MAG: hypothetical protein ACKOWF_13810 [Chloroflexota bacterium]
MSRGFGNLFVRPLAVFIGVLVVAAAIILFIGMTLLRLHPEDIIHGNLRSEFLRADLVVAFGLSVLTLVVFALIARDRPSEGVLDEERVIGSTDFFEPAMSPLDENRLRGPVGTAADIKPGDTLYASNGALARVIGMLPGEEEFGRKRRGLIYATGMHGANDEMWIPVEAVMGVYPETGTVILAAKGDEIEHFGWNKPPASFQRVAPPHAAPKSF